MACRFDHLDSWLLDVGSSLYAPYEHRIRKYMCDVRYAQHVGIHSFRSLGRHHHYSRKEAYFLHYKMPSLHESMAGKFRHFSSGVRAEIVDELKRTAGEYCSPEWRESVAHPDWRDMVRVDPEYHFRPE